MGPSSLHEVIVPHRHNDTGFESVKKCYKVLKSIIKVMVKLFLQLMTCLTQVVNIT